MLRRGCWSTQAGAHCGPNLMPDYLNIASFIFLTVCLHSISTLLWRCIWNRLLPVATKPWPLSLTTWFQILITSSVMFVPVPPFFPSHSAINVQAPQPLFCQVLVVYWGFSLVSVSCLIFVLQKASLIKYSRPSCLSCVQLLISYSKITNEVKKFIPPTQSAWFFFFFWDV